MAQIPGTITRSARRAGDRGLRQQGDGLHDIPRHVQARGQDSPSEEGGGETGLNEIKTALQPVLQRGPIVLTATLGETDIAVCEIGLEDAHLIDDVKTKLETAGLIQPTVTPLAGRPHSFEISGTASKDKSEALVRRRADGVRGPQGFQERPLSPMSPLPESSFVGAQVGGELRDKAVLALALSLLGTILYLARSALPSTATASHASSRLRTTCSSRSADSRSRVDGDPGGGARPVDDRRVPHDHRLLAERHDRHLRPRAENLRKSKKPLPGQVLNDSINERSGRTILTDGDGHARRCSCSSSTSGRATFSKASRSACWSASPRACTRRSTWRAWCCCGSRIARRSAAATTRRRRNSPVSSNLIPPRTRRRRRRARVAW